MLGGIILFGMNFSMVLVLGGCVARYGANMGMAYVVGGIVVLIFVQVMVSEVMRRCFSRNDRTGQMDANSGSDAGRVDV